MSGSRGSRGLVAGLVLAGALGAMPAAAQAATLETKPSKRCYGTGDAVGLAGKGFKRSGAVNIRRDGKLLNRSRRKVVPIRTGPAGGFAIEATAPGLARAVRVSTYTAIDRSNSRVRASARVRLSDLRVRFAPEDAAATRPRKIFARGFTARGRALYGHVVRKGRVRTFRVGRLKGRCKRASATRRLFGRKAARGTYTVQFDAFERYSRRRLQKVRYTIRVRGGASSAAAAVVGISGGVAAG